MNKSRILVLLSAATLMAACGKKPVEKPVSSDTTPTTSEVKPADETSSETKTSESTSSSEQKTSSSEQKTSSSEKTSSSSSSKEEKVNFQEEYENFKNVRLKTLYKEGGSPLTIDNNLNMVQKMEMSGMTNQTVMTGSEYVSTDGKKNFYDIFTTKMPNESGKLVTLTNEEIQEADSVTGDETRYVYKESEDKAESYKLSKGHIEHTTSLGEILGLGMEVPAFDPTLGNSSRDEGFALPKTYGELAEEIIDMMSTAGTMLEDSYNMPLFSSYYEETKSAVKGKEISFGFVIHYTGIGETENKGSIEGVKSAKWDVTYDFTCKYASGYMDSMTLSVSAVFDVKGQKSDCKMEMTQTLADTLTYEYDDEHKPAKKDSYTPKTQKSEISFYTPNGCYLTYKQGELDTVMDTEGMYPSYVNKYYEDPEMTKPVTQWEFKSWNPVYYYEPNPVDTTKVALIDFRVGRNSAEEEEYNSYIGNSGGTQWHTETPTDGKLIYSTWNYKKSSWDTDPAVPFKVDNILIEDSNDPNCKWVDGVLTLKAGCYAVIRTYGTKI